MNYTYMIQKSGKKGKEWTNAQKGDTNGTLNHDGCPHKGYMYSEWVRGGGRGKKGLKKKT